MKCESCRPHKFQDETYGKNMRVHNQTGNKNTTEYRCTICENIK